METKNTVVDRKSETTSAAPGAKPADSAKPEIVAKPELVAAAAIGFVPDMLDVLSTSKSRSSGGAKIRMNVGYTLVAENVKKLAGTSVPEQEQVILKILNRSLTPAKPVISEPELNKLILAAHTAGALKTKQEPWHIFRYYRTDLVKRGVLKQVDISLAS